VKLGLSREVRAKPGMPVWRRDDAGQSCALKLTANGLKAIAVDDGSKDAIARREAPQPQLNPDATKAFGPDIVGERAKTLTPRAGSKLGRVIDQLQRSEGATIPNLIEVTGLLAHTTRAALTGLRKRGYAVARERIDKGESIYLMGPAIDGGERVVVETKATWDRGRQVRARNGKLERVVVLEEGFVWNGQTYCSLSQIARAMTGTNWNGHRFFGASAGKDRCGGPRKGSPKEEGRRHSDRRGGCSVGRRAVKDRSSKSILRCAIYTRVSTDQGLEQDFNSLDSQREASEAYVKSEAHEGWRLIRDHYDDGGYSGGSIDRLALQKLLADVEARRIEVIVVYKVDRLTRSLADFAKLVEMFDRHEVSFVSVTQSFNTTSSMGRLTLNVLLSFAQFEREVTGERTRDKIAASKKKGMWMGGVVPLGYRVEGRALHVVEDHPEILRSFGAISTREASCASNSVSTRRVFGFRSASMAPAVRPAAARSAGRTSTRSCRIQSMPDGSPTRGVHQGQHKPIVPQDLWDQVQQRLRDRHAALMTKRTRQSSGALLAGKLFDGRGNRMSPSWAKKGTRRLRYYVSQAALQCDKSKAGSIVRVPAAAVEALVAGAVGKLSPGRRIASRPSQPD
jgi:DNA invertase Pin-like site-specific DNA recombinase